MESKSENKTLRSFLLGFVVLVLVVCAFGGGLATGTFLPVMRGTVTTTPITSNGDQTGTTATDQEALFAPFWQAWDLVHENYYIQPVDDVALLDGAIRGMVDALPDAHSTYLDPQESTDANSEMQGSYAGIGAYVDTEAEFLTIVRPIPGSPAEAKGLQAGDMVIAVDGEDVTGMDGASVRMKVLGEPGTDVVLTIVRGEEAPFDVTITRAVITIPSVESRMLDGNIGYIKISIFGENTAQDFEEQLGVLMEQNPDGIILDLRDNTGGYLTAAISIASQFISSGPVVIERERGGTLTPYEASGDGIAYDVPVMVLVNNYTASASEIVSGALQDTGRGQLVGVTTYGKGTVQLWFSLSNSGTIRVTIAEWLTPNERTIHEVGLTPDIIVEMTQEDYNAGLDPQLDAAIEALGK